MTATLPRPEPVDIPDSVWASNQLSSYIANIAEDKGPIFEFVPAADRTRPAGRLHGRTRSQSLRLPERPRALQPRPGLDACRRRDARPRPAEHGPARAHPPPRADEPGLHRRVHGRVLAAHAAHHRRAHRRLGRQRRHRPDDRGARDHLRRRRRGAGRLAHRARRSTGCASASTCCCAAAIQRIADEDWQAVHRSVSSTCATSCRASCWS